MSYQVTFTNELCHHGIKGQKWGIRRFRNEDGSLTNEGKKRQKEQTKKKMSTKKKVAIGAGVAGAVGLGAYVIHKNRQYIRNKASKRQIKIGKKNVSKLVDLEIQSRINYADAKNAKDIKGMIKEKKRIKDYGKAAKKMTDTYTREAHKLKTGTYKNAKEFLLKNHKPYDYLEDLATGGVIGAAGGTAIGYKIKKRRRQENR